MKHWWLKFGCFLTGYNYNILEISSEASSKTVKRYTSAMVIVCILWFFIGFVFTRRYLLNDKNPNNWGAIAGGLVLFIIIIQVERQIILANHKNWGMYLFRVLIGLAMAIIGSVVIDQIIFAADIEQQKIIMMDAKVKKVLPSKAAETKRQIAELDSIIDTKEIEKKNILDDVSRHPVIPIVNKVKTQTKLGNSIQTTETYTLTKTPNPKMAFYSPLDDEIKILRTRKSHLDSTLLQLRPMIENDFKSHVGFLDELNAMKDLITNKDSKVALGVWLLWFCFLLGLELFIMISKIGEEKNDYDAAIEHHMESQMLRLQSLKSK